MAIDVNMFWHGPELGPMHAACVRSFLRHGHRVIMHCYEPPRDLPDGVKLFDAAKIMPATELVQHKKSGSVALGSDRYRYRIIAAGLGLYADCDMFCLRPLTNSPYLFGVEQTGVASCGVLNFPPNSPLLKALIKATDDPYFIPPWLKSSERRRLQFRKMLGRGVHVSKQEWGVWGPRLLTFYVSELGLWSEAAPIDRYYPLHYGHVSLLRDPALRLADLITPRTDAVHLWHALLGDSTPPPGSPLHEIMNS